MKNLPSVVNVLLIDDSPAITRAVRKFLEGTEFEVFSAGTTVEGLSLVSDVSPHFILIDASMPDIDGYQFAYLIRSFRSDSGIKLVLLELKSNQIDIEKFNGGNFFEKLLKPFTREELLSILEGENDRGLNTNR